MLRSPAMHGSMVARIRLIELPIGRQVGRKDRYHGNKRSVSTEVRFHESPGSSSDCCVIIYQRYTRMGTQIHRAEFQI